MGLKPRAVVVIDIESGRVVCAICRHAHKGDTLYCMIGKKLQERKPDESCGRFYPVPCRKLVE